MIGRTLSQFQIVEEIGRGGMGEVYKALDTKLGREVAVKVLPALFSKDTERLARFEREARVLASLNHPNIATLFDLRESDGVHFLVLELVPGETLAERIKRGPIPIDEALPIFKQIADALEAAHENGIIHRDLKPPNVKVGPDGKVKVLDFGLAKALTEGAPVDDSSQSPTLTRGTALGTIMGTAAYMSPEQARAKSVDKRTDIWAFGCCLYETLTGRKVFEGETVSDTISAILKEAPEWEALPHSTPSGIRRLLRRSLEKDAGARLHDVADARLDVVEAMIAPRDEPLGAAEPVSRNRLSTVSTALVGAVIAGILIWAVMRTTEPVTSPVTRLTVTVPKTQQLYITSRGGIAAPALSPDGKWLAYIAQQADTVQLYLRDLQQFEARAIQGSEGADTPFFSPDSRWLAFEAEGKLKKAAVTGGAPQTVCDAPRVSRGATWGSDGTIVFCSDNASAFYQVAADGGTPELLTEARPNSPVSYQYPAFLPDSKGIVFSTLDPDRAGLITLCLESGEEHLLLDGNVDRARYVPSGYMVYSQESIIMAVPFDLAAMTPKSQPLPVVEAVNRAATGAALFSVSDTGTLAYVPGGSDFALVTVDRNGRALPLLDEAGTFWMPGLSPDGKRLAVFSREGKTYDVWIYDIEQGTRIRLTTDGFSGWPIWTRDGERITFSSNGNLCWAPADGSGSVQTLLDRANAQRPVSWSPDNKTLAFQEISPHTGADVYLLHLGTQEPEALIHTAFDERAPQFSPDGRWLAYVSNESGRNEVYVRAYSGVDQKWIVSAKGGSEPRWSSDGRELLYRQGGKMMVAAVTTDPTFSIGERRELFDGPYDSNPSSCLPAYDVTSDGKHFVTSMPDLDSMPRQINIFLNWFDELTRLVPTRN